MAASLYCSAAAVTCLTSNRFYVIFKQIPRDHGGASLMATGYLVDGGHAQDDESQAQLNGSTSMSREKVRSATLRRRWSILWRPAQRGVKLTYRPVMESHGVVLDSLRRRVQVDGYVVHLSAREA